MLMNLPPTSAVIVDHVPALSEPQSDVRRMPYQRWSQVAQHFLTCLDVARQRRQLLALDERTLKDVGISRIDALQEANRSFWDIPEHLKLHRPVHPAGKAETTPSA